MLPGPAPHPDRDPAAGDRQPDHDLRQVITAVLGLAVSTEPGGLVRVGAVFASGLLAPPVPQHRLVGLVQLEIGAGGVEEQQVHLQVQQVRHLVVDLPFQPAADRIQPVHRPVARVIAGLGEPVDVHVAAHPLRRGQLGGRGQRPVGDQPEHDPLGRRAVPRPAPAPGTQPGQDGVDAQPVPQRVQHVGAAVGPGLGEHQPVRRGGGHQFRGIQQPGQRPDQPPDRLLVQLVLAAEAVQQLRHRPARGSVPLVVRKVQVADLAALDLAARRLHVHRSRGYSRIGVTPGTSC